MLLKVKPERKNWGIEKATEEAGAYDVIASKIVQDRNMVTVYLGFSTEIPKGWRGRIVPRSSITHKSWIMANSPAVIDSDFRKEWLVKFECVKPATQLNLFEDGTSHVNVEFPWKEGERCAQIYFERVDEIEIELVDSLTPSKRGSGFGDTGK